MVVTDEIEVPGVHKALSGTSTSSTISLYWRPADNTGPPPLEGYQVQYREDSSSNSLDGSTNSALARRAVFYNLAPSTTYRLQVRSRSPEGDSAYVQIVLATKAAISQCLGTDMEAENPDCVARTGTICQVVSENTTKSGGTHVTKDEFDTYFFLANSGYYRLAAEVCSTANSVIRFRAHQADAWKGDIDEKGVFANPAHDLLTSTTPEWSHLYLK